MICEGPRRSQIALPETRVRLDGMCHGLSVRPAASRGELAARPPACFHAFFNFHVCKDIRLIAIRKFLMLGCD